jgi:phosphatidylinositol alpha-mannosyltransferase
VHVRELGGRLLARGHEVLALAPARRRPREPWVVRVGRPLDVPYNMSTAPISPWPSTARRTRRALAAFGPDVVHAHEPFTPSASLFALLWGRAPVVATFHSGADRSRLFDLAAPALRRLARRIAVRVAVSERAAAFARDRIGGDFEVVPNGIDARRFAEAEPADLGPGRKLLFVGRLHARKGFHLAVAAFGELAERFDDLRLVVAGDGEERAALGALPPSARERVAMLGTVPNAELPRFAAACDVYVGPSVGGESFGVVLAEAMAAGLPVVASDIPGYEEVVRDGVDGLLVPPGDPRALAEAAARVLEDDGFAAKLAAAGRERARGFDWDVVVARLEELYERARGRGPLR